MSFESVVQCPQGSLGRECWRPVHRSAGGTAEGTLRSQGLMQSEYDDVALCCSVLLEGEWFCTELKYFVCRSR